VLCATPSHSQGSLTAEQAAARDAFDQQVGELLAKAKDKCGDDFKLVTDFEHYDEAAWKAEHGRHLRGMTATACGQALEAAATVCAGPVAHSGKGRAPTTPQPAAVSVKRVTCLFTGADEKKRGEEHEDHMRRNAKFVAGELTLRISPQMKYLVPGTYEGVLRGTASYRSLEAGASCKKHWECGSGLCSGGACRTCSAKRKCPDKFDVCEEGGVCRMAPPPNHSSSSSSSDTAGASSGGKKRGKGLGQGCKSTSECEEGRVCSQRTGKLRTCQ